MRHGSLFNGIGGFQLAADQMEWENVFSSEIDDFCNKVTKFHFPNCIQHKDVRTTDFTIYRGHIDVLTGGFPCQPYSVTGKRKGKEDARHLWPEMRRAVREIQPGWVVGENVRGLINWSDGLVFHEVQADLEAEGYEVFPFLLPAAGVNAPHERYRIWFVAHMRSDGHERRRSYENRSAPGESERLQWQRLRDDLKRNGIEGAFANACESGLSAAKQKEFSGEVGNYKRRAVEQFPSSQSWDKRGFDNFPTQSPLCDGDDGLSSKLDGITFPKWRNESIKAGGNAIVPKLALQIFKAIEQYNCLTH